VLSTTPIGVLFGGVDSNGFVVLTVCAIASAVRAKILPCRRAGLKYLKAGHAADDYLRKDPNP
jgi:hypothetical protein